MKNSTKFKLVIALIIGLLTWRIYDKNLKPIKEDIHYYGYLDGEGDSLKECLKSSIKYRNGEEFFEEECLHRRTGVKLSKYKGGYIHNDSLRIYFLHERNYLQSEGRSFPDSTFKISVEHVETLDNLFDYKKEWTWFGDSMLLTRLTKRIYEDNDLINEIIYTYNLDGSIKSLSIDDEDFSFYKYEYGSRYQVRFSSKSTKQVGNEVLIQKSKQGTRQKIIEIQEQRKKIDTMIQTIKEEMEQY